MNVVPLGIHDRSYNGFVIEEGIFSFEWRPSVFQWDSSPLVHLRIETYYVCSFKSY